MNIILVFKYLVLAAAAVILLPKGSTLAVVVLTAAILLELLGDFFFAHGYIGTSLTKKGYGWCTLVGAAAAVWFWFSWQNLQDPTWLTRLGLTLLFFHVAVAALAAVVHLVQQYQRSRNAPPLTHE